MDKIQIYLKEYINAEMSRLGQSLWRDFEDAHLTSEDSIQEPKTETGEVRDVTTIPESELQALPASLKAHIDREIIRFRLTLRHEYYKLEQNNALRLRTSITDATSQLMVLISSWDDRSKQAFEDLNIRKGEAEVHHHQRLVGMDKRCDKHLEAIRKYAAKDVTHDMKKELRSIADEWLRDEKTRFKHEVSRMERQIEEVDVQIIRHSGKRTRSCPRSAEHGKEVCKDTLKFQEEPGAAMNLIPTPEDVVRSPEFKAQIEEWTKRQRQVKEQTRDGQEKGKSIEKARDAKEKGRERSQFSTRPPLRLDRALRSMYPRTATAPPPHRGHCGSGI
jgi:uncharacterized protein YukE